MRRLPTGLVFLCAATAFASAFVLPSTRETQILLWRLLLRLPRENTSFANARPSGLVPRVWFSPSFRNPSPADEPGDPDTYVLGRSIHARLNHFPAPGLWKGHPLARWAAMDRARDIWPLKPPAAAGTRLTVVPLQLTGPVSNLLATIRQAQFEYPTEGGLWLAEAAVLFEMGDDNGGYNCAWGAINRGGWTRSMDAFRERAGPLLRARGLPRLEADEIVFQALWGEPHFQLVHCVCDSLMEMATRAIQAGEYDAADECLITFLGVGAAARESFGLIVDLERHVGFDELVAAMAARSGRSVPSHREVADYDAVQAAEERVFADYLERFSVPGLQGLVVVERERNCRTYDELYARGRAHTDRRGRIPVLPGLAGSLAVLLAGVLVCGLIAEVPFLLASPVKLGSQELFPWSFLPLLFIALAAMMLVLFSPLHAVFGGDDLSWKARGLLPERYLLALLAFCMSIPIAGVRRVLVWHPGWYRAAWLGLLALQLLAVRQAAETRRAALEGLMPPFVW